MKEKRVETYIREYLKQEGWTVKKRPGIRGIDVEAQKNGRSIVIEVKGEGAHSTAMRNNYLSVFGQIIMDMNDKDAEYFIAFPVIKTYTRLWDRLPQLAKEKTGINVIWVSRNGNVEGI